MKRIKKKITRGACSARFTVIRFIENNTKLFDCIPDIWFTDENKDSCFWPPLKGKSVAVRALKEEIPDESWEKYTCEVVREGFATYSLGRVLVREKCLQTYNTSSADEHIEAARFRRKHPGLNFGNFGSFEDVFATQKPVKSVKDHQTKENNSSKHDSNNNSEDLTLSDRPISTMSDKLKQAAAPNSSHHSIPNVVKTKNSGTISSCHNSPTSIISYTTICSISSSRIHYRGSRDRQISCVSSSDRRRSSIRSRSKRSKSSSPINRRSLGRRSNISSDSSRRRSSIRSHSKRCKSSSSINRRSLGRRSNISSASSRGRSLIRNHSKRSKSSSRINRRSPGRRSNISSASSRRRSSIRNHSKRSSLSSPIKRRSPGRRSTITSASSSDRRRSSIHSHSKRSKSSSGLNDRRSKNSSKRTSKRSRRQRSKASSDNSIDSRPSPKRNGLASDSHIRIASKNLMARKKHVESTSVKHRNSGSHHISSNTYRPQSSAVAQVQSPHKNTFVKNLSDSCSSSCRSKILMNKLTKDVRELSETVHKNHQQNDRRLSRMEVTINKTLVRLGDITRSNASNSINEEPQSNCSRDISRRMHEDVREYPVGSSRSFLPLPREPRVPELPIFSLNELSDVNQQLKNKEFFKFYVNQEKEFCVPSRNVTNNVVMTTYLARFIALRVRVLLTLKDLKGGEGLTLFADFRNVYLFLIEVMQEGYKCCKKSLTAKEAHEALRIVWGRSKQLKNDLIKKRK